jgi:serine/threonine protein kinase
MFWKMHEKIKPEVFGSLSEDLKNLIVGLLQYNPVHRLSLSEIITHKWLQGPVSSKEEIY